jgi:signal transduction histidine kinase
VALTGGIGLMAGYMSAASLFEPPLAFAFPAATAALLSVAGARAGRRAAHPAVAAKAAPAAVPLAAPGHEPGAVTSSVLEMATSFTSANEPAEIASRIAQGAVEQLQATGAVLLVWNPTAGSYRIAAVRGQDVPGIRDILQVEVSPQSLPVLDTSTAGRAVTLPVLGFSEPVVRSLLRRWRANKILGVQLRRNEKELGLLVAARGEQEPEFDDRDREIVTSVSMHAAAALAHAQSIAELEAANALKEEFMATMSHELRTPLNVIIGYTDLQLDEAFGELGEDHRSTLETVRGQAIQLLELIQATLDMSRLERGLVQVELTDVAIPQFLEGLNRQIPPSWRKPGVGLHWNVQTGLPTLRTDPSKLQMLLRNLVHNALKFTQNGLVSVSVSSDAVRRVVTFIVQDSGVGIRAEHLSDIFEMFRQGPEGRSTTGGVGLGLYIVKRLAELLGAEIEVSSAPGRGATFRINVPFDGPLAAR